MKLRLGLVKNCLIALILLGTILSTCARSSPESGPDSRPQPTSAPTQTAPHPTESLATPAGARTPTPAPLVMSTENRTAVENRMPGSDDWQPSPVRGPGAIAGFTDQPSVNAGEAIRFAISTSKEGIPYLMEVNRLGWYGGKGGRRVLVINALQGVAQGYWDRQREAIVDCPTCQVDAATGLIDTRWRYTYQLSVPHDWVSGEYLVKLTDQDGNEGYIHFIVREDNRASDLLVQVPTNGYQAGNTWGGYSLERFPRQGQIPRYGAKPAVKVSFNRPIAGMDPNYIYPDIQAIHFLERSGYNVTYTTSVDLERDPSALQRHRAFLSIGDDPYWTKGMRDALEQARDHGLNLAFLGGNSLMWQARYEPDLDGNPRRALALYRVAAMDPLAADDPANATVRFVDPPVSRPQNSLTGTLLGGYTSSLSGVPWLVAPTAPPDILVGTGLKAGDSISSLTGPDCGTIADNGFSPAGLEIIAASPLVTGTGEHVTCHTTMYKTRQGALVFNAGTSSWTMALDDFGHHNPGLSTDRRILLLTQNILKLFGAQPAAP